MSKINSDLSNTIDSVNNSISNQKVPSLNDINYIKDIVKEVIQHHNILISSFTAATSYIGPILYRNSCLNSNSTILGLSPLPHKELISVANILFKICTESGSCFRDLIEVSKLNEIEYFILKVDFVPILALKFIPNSLFSLINGKEIIDNYKLVSKTYLISELLDISKDLTNEDLDDSIFSFYKKNNFINCPNNNISIISTALTSAFILYRQSNIIMDGTISYPINNFDINFKFPNQVLDNVLKKLDKDDNIIIGGGSAIRILTETMVDTKDLILYSNHFKTLIEQFENILNETTKEKYNFTIREKLGIDFISKSAYLHYDGYDIYIYDSFNSNIPSIKVNNRYYTSFIQTCITYFKQIYTNLIKNKDITENYKIINYIIENTKEKYYKYNSTYILGIKDKSYVFKKIQWKQNKVFRYLPSNPEINQGYYLGNENYDYHIIN